MCAILLYFNAIFFPYFCQHYIGIYVPKNVNINNISLYKNRNDAKMTIKKEKERKKNKSWHKLKRYYMCVMTACCRINSQQQLFESRDGQQQKNAIESFISEILKDLVRRISFSCAGLLWWKNENFTMTFHHLICCNSLLFYLEYIYMRIK